MIFAQSRHYEKGVCMPRALRVLGNDLTYHIVANCNAKEFLFSSNDDFADFIEHLTRCQKNFHFALHAYCLLHSHVHLILTTKENIFLDKIMYEICQRFAAQYNKSHRRTGHFWKNRYFRVNGHFVEVFGFVFGVESGLSGPVFFQD